MKPFDEYWNDIVPALWDVEQWDNKKIKAVVRLAYEAGYDGCRHKYYELIYAVERKFPDETRHQTALRYIRSAEQTVNEPAQAEARHE